MKSAPEKSWKQLCYPEQGGGPDTLQVFLSERAETSTDDNVKALARAILSLCHLIEKRYTTMQNMKKGSTDKVEGQKLALMPFVYQCIKAFKHRTVKPSACAQLHHDILMKDFGQDFLLGLAALVEGALGLEPAPGGPSGRVERPEAPSGARPARPSRENCPGRWARRCPGRRPPR